MAKLFATAKEDSAARLFGMAIVQTVAFWGFFLVLLPALIVWLMLLAVYALMLVRVIGASAVPDRVSATFS